MEDPDQQVKFFQFLKNKSPQHLSFVDEVTNVLNISEDSAYRRIRGDKVLAFEELQQLCIHFKVSLDQLLKLPTHNILFYGRYIRPGEFDFASYLDAMLQLFKTILPLPDKEIIYLCKDIPVYHYYLFPEIVAFKYFSWMKTLLNFPALKNATFSVNILPPELLLKGRRIAEAYYQVPSTEILNPDNILTTLRQIEFYKDSGYFSSAKDIRMVYEALEETFVHLKHQVEYGCKFMPGENPESKKNNFNFFYNRVILGDNTIMVVTDRVKTAFINYDVLNYMYTRDETFSEPFYIDMQNMMKKSTLISQTGEKQRNVFFGILMNKIKERKKNL